MRNKIFSLLLVFLFCVSLVIVLKPQNTESSLEKRELLTVDELSFSSFIDGQLFDELDNLLKDQFILREGLVQSYYSWKIFLSKVVNVSDSLEEIEVLDDNVLAIGDGYLINNILEFNEEKVKNAGLKGYNINEMDLRYPDVKTYVYFPTRIEENLFLPGNSINNYGIKYKEKFINELNKNITTSELKCDSVELHKQLFYKTDFHWNNKGAYQGYSDIISMIGKDFTIGKPKRIIEEKCYPFDFYGNIASEIGQWGETDRICDYTLDDIGGYDYYINGVQSNLNESKVNYSKVGNDTMFSDYDIYFGENKFERIFDFHDTSKPNILIFGDSYINVIQEWLASHFNKTIIIDIRANNQTFYLDDYINNFDIDIILVSQMYHNLYFNGFTFIPLESR